ncbi:hypothetical protein ACA910_014220 [Epithemia clementina (nom. ined.)]
MTVEVMPEGMGHVEVAVPSDYSTMTDVSFQDEEESSDDHPIDPEAATTTNLNQSSCSSNNGNSNNISCNNSEGDNHNLIPNNNPNPIDPEPTHLNRRSSSSSNEDEDGGYFTPANNMDQTNMGVVETSILITPGSFDDEEPDEESDLLLLTQNQDLPTRLEGNPNNSHTEMNGITKPILVEDDEDDYDNDDADDDDDDKEFQLHSKLPNSPEKALLEQPMPNEDSPGSVEPRLPTTSATNSDWSAPRPPLLSLLPEYCKVQEPGSYDPLRFRLIPVKDFLVTRDRNEEDKDDMTAAPEMDVSLERLTHVVAEAFSSSSSSTNDKNNNNEESITTIAWNFHYRDSMGDVVLLTSSSILRKALEEYGSKLRILIRSIPVIKPWPTSVRIHLVAKWEENLETSFSSCRLIDRTVEQPPRISHLKVIASNQFNLPAHSMSFRVVFSTSSDDGNVTTDADDVILPPRRIVCDEDLADALFSSDQKTLRIEVELELATVTRICYPTIDNDTLSRRIPLQSLVGANGKMRLEKILETVADSLDTDEFVLTYTIQNKTSDSSWNSSASKVNESTIKYFITCPEDLLDAMRQFPGGELVLIPQVPQQAVLESPSHEENNVNDATQTPPLSPERLMVAQPRMTSPEKKSRREREGIMLKLSFQGREGASVVFPMNSVLDDRGNAAYWKLLGIAVKSFHLGTTSNGTPPPVCLFYVYQEDGTRAEITTNAYLTEILHRDSVGKEEHIIRVEPVAFSLTSFAPGLSLRRFSLSHVMSNDGVGVSFLKLVRLSRVTDPVIGLTYYDNSRNKVNILSDKDLAMALQEFPAGDLVIRPIIQCNPYILSVRDAMLTGKKCKLGSWATPNIMFKSYTAMACWDLSDMLHGRYRVSARYWRDMYKGPANLRIGIVVGTDKKTVTRKLAADHDLLVNFLTNINLPPTGIAESDFSKLTPFGEYNVRSVGNHKEGETCFLILTTIATPSKEEPEEVILVNSSCRTCSLKVETLYVKESKGL